MYKFLSGHMFSFLLGIYVEVGFTYYYPEKLT